LGVSLRAVFGAGLRYAVAMRAAVPVEAQGGGVVGGFADDGVEERMGEVLSGNSQHGRQPTRQPR
jgi:hypothetical protein